ncbi:MAG: hypothetical protein GY757_13270 [bacterium]|nr:hypothetical protein [bacterium]
MRCLKKNEIMEFIDNELAPEKQNEMENHLETCSKCREKIAQRNNRIQQLRQNFQLLEPLEIPEKPFEEPEYHNGPGIKSQTGTGQRIKTWLKGLLDTSVAIPVPALIILLVVFSLMTATLISQHNKIAGMKIPFLANNQKSLLYFVNEKNIEAKSLDIDIDQFKPMNNPKIYKAREITQ